MTVGYYPVLQNATRYPEAITFIHGLGQSMRMTCDDLEGYTWYGYGAVYALAEKCCIEGTTYVWLCVSGEPESPNNENPKGVWLLNGLTSKEIGVNGPFSFGKKENEHVHVSSKLPCYKNECEIKNVADIWSICDEYKWDYVIRYINDQSQVDVMVSGPGILKDEYRIVAKCA